MQKSTMLLTALLIIGGASQTAHAHGRSGSSRHHRASPYSNWTQIGQASWYGGRFIGHRTANGERYDANALTCAHRTLPLGSLVRVTALKTGKSLVLTVNDRGPYVGHRVLDLSEGTARKLGSHEDGLLKVKIHVLEVPSKFVYHRPPRGLAQVVEARQ